jgi:hypothetical protein
VMVKKVKKTELAEEAWKDLAGPGDFPWDIELKEKVYTFLQKKHTPSDCLMLTKCYFNKIKYGCVYTSKIEEKIKKIEI